VRKGFKNDTDFQNNIVFAKQLYILMVKQAFMSVYFVFSFAYQQRKTGIKKLCTVSLCILNYKNKYHNYIIYRFSYYHDNCLGIF